ncbi:MAG: hypothetical protein CVU11_13525 [Bacteroidetes bacterium HGW-Bacteroidetes-6]|nr:MAG: hypothetical protein CVU11_13525 [Bacteroidetes bacterium HGW-Bacteroidetes-6]
MFCMQCGKELPDSAKFCVGCGTPTPGNSPQEKAETREIEIDENKPAEYAWGADNPDMKGLHPVRMKHLPPTDRAKVEAATIDTRGQHQISARVIKSQTAKGAYSVPIVFALLAGTLAAGGFAVQEKGLGAISLAVAAFLIFLAIVMGSNRRKNFRLGFDWKTNTIWAMLEGKKPSYLGNASCITALNIEKTVINNRRIANVGTTSNRMYTTVNDKKKIWQLIVNKTDGSSIPLFTFYSASDAAHVHQKAVGLLQAQK